MTLSWLRVIVFVVAAASIATPISAQKSKPVTGESVRAIEAWVRAVTSHAPGRADDAVRDVATWSFEDRVELDAGMAGFLAGLLGQSYNPGGNPAAKMIVEAGRRAGAPDANAFLKRAAVLHADVAFQGDQLDTPPPPPPPPDDARPQRPNMTMPIAREQRISPLLERSRLLLSRDGELISETTASWNWPFARFLLDLVGTARGKRAAAHDPFVVAWYHATNAGMFAGGKYGDLTPHLKHAEDLLPDDPLILFDRGCYAEVLGLPLLQSVIPESDVVRQRLNNRGGPPTWIPPVEPPAVELPSIDKTNADAERLYRRALAIDPSLAEVRARLGRLLDLRGQHRSADMELTAVRAAALENSVAFYARLFAGRTSHALGQTATAAQRYQEALELFPNAQSALLGQSQLALIQADANAALASIERLGDRSLTPESDPWWGYHLCAGRNADDLLKSMWARTPR